MMPTRSLPYLVPVVSRREGPPGFPAWPGLPVIDLQVAIDRHIVAREWVPDLSPQRGQEEVRLERK